MALLVDLLPAPGSDPVAVLDAFAVWAAEGGRSLYPHQEEAALALAAGDHVVLATPTGSGKSLVAVAGILLARNEGRRAVWTAPIKALVAEKFFDLVDLSGCWAGWAGDGRRGDQRGGAGARVHGRGPCQPGSDDGTVRPMSALPAWTSSTSTGTPNGAGRGKSRCSSCRDASSCWRRRPLAT